MFLLFYEFNPMAKYSPICDNKEHMNSLCRDLAHIEHPSTPLAPPSSSTDITRNWGLRRADEEPEDVRKPH